VRRRGPLLALALAAAGAAAVAAAGFVLAGDANPGTTSAGSAPPPQVEQRPPAPALAGIDVVTGKRLALADYSNRPVVLAVWSSWCVACGEQAEALRRFSARHDDVVVLGLNTLDTRGDARRAARDWGWTHPSLFDADGALAARLELTGLPETFFLDSDHRIAARHQGPLALPALEEGLDEATRRI
jgi:peroxiredoxin